MSSSSTLRRAGSMAYLATAVGFILLGFFNDGNASVFCSASGTEAAMRPSRHATAAVENGNFINNTPHSARERRLGGPTGGLHVEPSHAAKVSLGEGGTSPAAPEQVHIALAVADSQEEYAMTVAWATWPEAQSQVVWGSSADELTNLVEGTATTYSANAPGRAAYTSGFLHSATIEGLQPSTTYYYSCGDEKLALSTVRSFVTPPKVGGDQQITLGILGDLGQTEDSMATLAGIDEDGSLDLVLHAGDLSYADCDQPRWDSFMRMLDPVASRLPWMVCAGNHEIEAGATENKPFVAYEHRFRMPAVSPPESGFLCGVGGGLDGDASARACGEGLGDVEAELAATVEAELLATVGGGIGAKSAGQVIRETARRVREAAGVRVDGEEEEEEKYRVSCCPSEWSGTYDYGNSFYSFNAGPVHVLVLNPYAATGENSVQHDWAQKDLESTDRTLTTWVVVVMHCPWYNSNLAHQGERQAETAMKTMEPLLYQHKVAVVVTGHVHAYERSHPVVNYEITEDGPVHLVVGGAGNREGHAAEFYPSPEWSAFRDGTVYGSGRLSIRGSSLALWEWTSPGGASDMHDIAWISNPFSPYAPGEEGEPPAVAGVREHGEDARDEGRGREDGKGRVGGGLRAPVMDDSRIHATF